MKKKKFFKNCPETCTSCKECRRYSRCKQRAAELRARREAEQNVQVRRRPKNAYSKAVFKSWLEKITLKRVITVIAVILAVIILAQPISKAFVGFVSDLNEGLNVTVIEVAECVPTPEIANDSKIVNEEMAAGNNDSEMNEAEKPKYPDAAPGEVYKPTYEGPRPYRIYFFTYEERIMMAKVVYKEARGECEEGRVAVAAVIINRVFNDQFDDSVKGVIEYPNAFANISGVSDELVGPGTECWEAVEKACHGWDPTRLWFEETGALYFYNPDGNMSDEARAQRDGIEKYSIGNHMFHIELNYSNN